jgi:hypothetical protein
MARSLRVQEVKRGDTGMALHPSSSDAALIDKKSDIDGEWGMHVEEDRCVK